MVPDRARLRHTMHELSACLLFAWLCIDSSLRITSTPAAAWALTALCSVMHCNLQTSLREGWGGVGRKRIPSPSFLPVKLLSTLPAPFSSCFSCLLFTPFILLHSSSPSLLLPYLSQTCLLVLPHCITFVTIQPMLQTPKTGPEYCSIVCQSTRWIFFFFFRSLFCSTCV